MYLLTVWLHVLAAMAWVGGLLFIGLVLVPMMRHSSERGGAPLDLSMAVRRFRWVAWTALGILLVTGLAGLVMRGMSDPAAAMWAQPFGRILAVKLAVVLPVLLLSAFHDFAIGPRAAALRRAGDPRQRRLGKIASWVARLTLLLTLIIVALAIVMVRATPK